MLNVIRLLMAMPTNDAQAQWSDTHPQDFVDTSPLPISITEDELPDIDEQPVKT